MSLGTRLRDPLYMLLSPPGKVRLQNLPRKEPVYLAPALCSPPLMPTLCVYAARQKVIFVCGQKSQTVTLCILLGAFEVFEQGHFSQAPCLLTSRYKALCQQQAPSPHVQYNTNSNHQTFYCRQARHSKKQQVLERLLHPRKSQYCFRNEPAIPN